MERSEIRDWRFRISALRASIRATSCPDTKGFSSLALFCQTAAHGAP